MNDRPNRAPVSLNIAAVERDTGLSKDTLRVWERRYGFPSPARDAFGERVYPLDQVDKLRAIRRLMDAGHRPGKIIGLEAQALQALAARTTAGDGAATPAATAVEELAHYVALVRSHRVDELRRALSQALLRLGLERFVVRLAAPLNHAIGDAWAAGRLEIFEEHLYTESMQVVLRNAIGNIPPSGQRPRVLLTTFPGEAHGLGLLMVEALLALDGCRCTSLGTQTPVWDIVLAAEAQGADVVALSFTASLGANAVLEGLAELRAKLPAPVELWAGGRSPVLQRRPPASVRVLPDLQDVPPALAAWRAAHPEAGGG